MSRGRTVSRPAGEAFTGTVTEIQATSRKGVPEELRHAAVRRRYGSPSEPAWVTVPSSWARDELCQHRREDGVITDDIVGLFDPPKHSALERRPRSQFLAVDHQLAQKKLHAARRFKPQDRRERRAPPRPGSTSKSWNKEEEIDFGRLSEPPPDGLFPHAEEAGPTTVVAYESGRRSTKKPPTGSTCSTTRQTPWRGRCLIARSRVKANLRTPPTRTDRLPADPFHPSSYPHPLSRPSSRRPFYPTFPPSSPTSIKPFPGQTFCHLRAGVPRASR